jgi:CheY-like chemotaxis protein
MPPKILSVDDSKTIRTIIRKMLLPYDCELIEAKDGMEGLQMARELNPDLIILDIDMPRMNGMEVLLNLRNDDKSRRTPVFMLTSKSKEKNVRVAMKLGVKAFIGKPFKQQELIERIQNFLPLSSL